MIVCPVCGGGFRPLSFVSHQQRCPCLSSAMHFGESDSSFLACFGVVPVASWMMVFSPGGITIQFEPNGTIRSIRRRAIHSLPSSLMQEFVSFDDIDWLGLVQIVVASGVIES